ncbi:MAG: MBL fold metallo-hydrolase [Deltaproteobacteria bacterium]|nr:MBL fold metallo-hydrolase [Deltaproteobacteria bacterium]MBW1963127.1 MBL fold metallo-hydrolase [Deltaproteobacteria bacterium]MBW1995379.1 MBL fold metallo-hydrolase [Deltaproteobacteria bacterium]MBW2150905.1 MBL fold metallo-hydrolase [Deltaproteobacteria bacterium]
MTVEIRYLGWTAFELTTEQGTRILLDPLLEGRSHDGIPPSPVRAEELYHVNFVLITHGAEDHVGQAFKIVKHSNAILVCDASTAFCAEKEGGIAPERIYRMVSGVQFAFDEVTIKALPAKHLSLRKTGDGFISAQPLSYLIGISSKEQIEQRIFFGGDTSIHSDLKLYGELYEPQLAMLGVGGVDVHGQSLTELYPNEAALAAKWLGVRVAIPMHYRFGEGKEFIEELKKQQPDIKGLLLEPGERYIFAL